MPAADREWVEAETRKRSQLGPEWGWQPTEAQIAESAALAVDLYETAAGYGINKAGVDAVTSVIDSAIDMIRARDRAKS